jgi:speckle-type POZ protein
MVTKTASTVVLHAGEHLFKIVGHSLVKDSNTCLTSGPFRVGGHDWAILYYPNGDSRVVDDQFSSVFLQLKNTGDAEVVASYSFCLQDSAPPATGEKHRFSYSRTKFALIKRSTWGTIKFVSKADLVASGCLEDDDSLLIKCTVTVIASKLMDGHEDIEDSIIVPPSVLSKDLGNLLENGLDADFFFLNGRPLAQL